jgi:mRNA interferase RelE/StbE
VEFISSAITKHPRRTGMSLRGPLEGLYSARRGESRVTYVIDDERVVVLVVTIAHRRNACRP